MVVRACPVRDGHTRSRRPKPERRGIITSCTGRSGRPSHLVRAVVQLRDCPGGSTATLPGTPASTPTAAVHDSGNWVEMEGSPRGGHSAQEAQTGRVSRAFCVARPPVESGLTTRCHPENRRSDRSYRLSGRYRLSTTDDNLTRHAQLNRDRGAVGHSAQRRLHAIQTLSQLSYSPTVSCSITAADWSRSESSTGVVPGPEPPIGHSARTDDNRATWRPHDIGPLSALVMRAAIILSGAPATRAQVGGAQVSVNRGCSLWVRVARERVLSNERRTACPFNAADLLERACDAHRQLPLAWTAKRWIDRIDRNEVFEEEDRVHSSASAVEEPQLAQTEKPTRGPGKHGGPSGLVEERKPCDEPPLLAVGGRFGREWPVRGP